MRQVKAILTVLFMFCACLALAQNSDLATTRLKLPIPDRIEGLSMVDGQLCAMVDGVPTVILRCNDDAVALWPDTVVGREAPEATSMAQRPGTADIYFTRPDRQGVSRLYLLRRREGKRPQVKRVKMEGMEVVQPAFSDDGLTLVFASHDGNRNFGGLDLWYCTAEGDGWSRPRNAGKRMNSRFDDLSPTFYGSYLIFASNGRDNDHAFYQLYATRFYSTRTEGDSIGSDQVGIMPVLSLPDAINISGADNFSLVFDSLSGRGYWLSGREEKRTVHSFSGGLEGVTLWGRATDREDRPLAGLVVEAWHEGYLSASTLTDADGFYSLFLTAGRLYDVRCTARGYFSRVERLTASTDDTINLISELRLDMPMAGLPIGQAIYYNDIYEPGAGLEIDRQGRQVLAPLVKFLADNPNLGIKASLYCDATVKNSFNKMLTERRINSLETYLRDLLPPSVSIVIRNGCQSADMCATGSGLSRLVVVITPTEKGE